MFWIPTTYGSMIKYETFSVIIVTTFSSGAMLYHVMTIYGLSEHVLGFFLLVDMMAQI